MGNWMVPVGTHALQAGVVIATLGFTHANSLIRPALLPLVAYLSVVTLDRNRADLPSKMLAGFISSNGFGLLLQYIELALISRWSFLADGPTSGAGGETVLRTESEPSPQKQAWYSRMQQNPRSEVAAILEAFQKRLQWGSAAAILYRAPGTPWQIKNIPPFDRKNPQKVPSWGRFMLGYLTTFMGCVLFIDSMSLRKPDAEAQAVTFAVEKVPFFTRLGEVSRKDLFVRGIVSTMGWFATYVCLQGGYALLALLGVGTGNSSVTSWPPQFGQIRDAFSVRTFWNSFWQQAFRRRFSNISHFVTYSCLRLPKGGLVGRYMHLAGAFLISGLLHMVEEYGVGLPLSQSRSVKFFLMQALGIMLEDAVKAVYRRVYGNEERRWHRFVGYAWFVFWMFWTTPCWFWPKYRQPQTDGKANRLLPFTVLGHFMKASEAKVKQS